MSKPLFPLRRRTFLRGLGLGIVAAPGFSVLSSRGSTLAGSASVIAMKNNQRVLSVDAVLAAPDGIQRPIYAYNGQLIGPTIRVKEGERLKIKVLNNLSVPTIVHWHGMH